MNFIYFKTIVRKANVARASSWHNSLKPRMCVFRTLKLEFPQFPFNTNTYNLLLIKPLTNLWRNLLVATCKIIKIPVFVWLWPFPFRPFSWFFSFYDLHQLIPCKRLTFPTMCMVHHHMSEMLQCIVYYVRSTYFLRYFTSRL